MLPDNRRNILADLLTVYANAGKTIVFTQTKREADEVAAGIAGVIPSEVHLLQSSFSSTAYSDQLLEYIDSVVDFARAVQLLQFSHGLID